MSAPAMERSEARAPATIKDILASNKALARFEAFAPEGVNATRLYKMSQLAIQQEPALIRANATELLQLMMEISSLGLEVNSPAKHAWIIPFERPNRVTLQVIIGYQGLLELAYRAGQIRTIHADFVTQEEVDAGLFNYHYGTEQSLRHTYGPDRDEDDTASFAFAYVHWTTPDGAEGFEVMPWSAVLRIRNASSGYRYAVEKGENSKTYKTNPWIAFEAQMGIKTVLRRAAKLWRKSPDLAKAATMDELSEIGLDYTQAFDLDPSHWSEVAPDPANEAGARPPEPQQRQDSAPPPEEEPPPPEQADNGRSAHEEERKEEAPPQTSDEAPAHEGPPEGPDGEGDGFGWGDGS